MSTRMVRDCRRDGGDPRGHPCYRPAADDGLRHTWYQYGAGVTEQNVVTQARYLVSSGLAAAGYDTSTSTMAGPRADGGIGDQPIN
jgi:hypothetical protein